MKKFVLSLSIVAIFATGCGISKQTRQIKALENCVYRIASADSLYVAGTNVTSLIKNKRLDMLSMPSLALGFLRRDIPFEGRINLQINNPTGDLAAINQFEYKVLLKDQELANGFVNQKVTVNPGETVIVPVRVSANIYQFLSNGKTLQQITEFIQGGTVGGQEKKGIITLKIKPTISLGGKLIQYPGYITIDKEISSKILL